MNVLDLFSGIGGFSLGLERAGMRTVAFCEIEPFCQAVLRKHWPDIPIFGDIRSLTAEALADANSKRELQSQGSKPDKRGWSGDRSIKIICGGFPCQDISIAGKGEGIHGQRSGLWTEFARVIGEIRPTWVIVENVSALLGRGIERVLGDLAALGFDAEWHCIPASSIGAPHVRDRVWILAHASRPGRRPDATGHGLPTEPAKLQQADGQARPDHNAPLCPDVADAHGSNRQWRLGPLQMGWGKIARQIANNGDFRGTEWSAEPDVGRVAYGIPARVDRLCGLGNAIVPQIAEIIGRAILSAN